MLPDLTRPGFWWQFGVSVARVIEIGIIFELLVLVVNYWIGRKLAPVLALDAHRDPAWRVKRRERLRQTARGLVRGVLYATGGLVVLDVFQAHLTPVYVVLAVVTAAGVATMWSLLRDAAVGYALLLEDAVAPGDEVELDGARGVVESLGWRALRLRTSTGDVQTLGYAKLQQFLVRTGEKQPNKPVAASPERNRRRSERSGKHD